MANVITFYDPKKGTKGKEYAIENIHEHDLIDADKMTHRELMFMGAKTSGTYNIRVIGKYLNIRREVDGVTTILNSNLDTHGQESTLQIVAVSGAKYYIEGALTYLYCSNNQLTTLDVSKCTALTYFNCYGNQLTTLDVTKCTALTSLNCSNNQLTTLDVSKCTALISLYCSNNQLTTLDVSKCTALNELYCNNTQLTTLDVTKCTALTYLDCYDSQLTTLDVSKCTALTYLDCNNNQLTALDVSKCTALTILACSNNQLTTLDVSKCTALTSLYCSNNQLTALDIAPNMSNLIVMYAYIADEGKTADDIRPILLSLPTATDSQFYMLDEDGEVFAALADAIAVAESKGWEVINGDY